MERIFEVGAVVIVGKRWLSWVRVWRNKKQINKKEGGVECTRVLEVVRTSRENTGFRVLECWS